MFGAIDNSFFKKVVHKSWSLCINEKGDHKTLGGCKLPAAAPDRVPTWLIPDAADAPLWASGGSAISEMGTIKVLVAPMPTAFSGSPPFRAKLPPFVSLCSDSPFSNQQISILVSSIDSRQMFAIIVTIFIPPQSALRWVLLATVQWWRVVLQMINHCVCIASASTTADRRRNG